MVSAGWPVFVLLVVGGVWQAGLRARFGCSRGSSSSRPTHAVARPSAGVAQMRPDRQLYRHRRNAGYQGAAVNQEAAERDSGTAAAEETFGVLTQG